MHGIVMVMASGKPGRGAAWASGLLLAATLGTLLVARIELPVVFDNVAKADRIALGGVIILRSMPLLAGVLAQRAYTKRPRRRWWVAFGALVLCWAGISLYVLLCIALSEGIKHQRLMP